MPPVALSTYNGVILWSDAGSTYGAGARERALCVLWGRGGLSRVIVSCSVGGLSLRQGDEHGEGLGEEPRGEAAGGMVR